MLTVPMYTCPLHDNEKIPYLVNIVDCVHVGSSIASPSDLVTLQENTTTDILG